MRRRARRSEGVLLMRLLLLLFVLGSGVSAQDYGLTTWVNPVRVYAGYSMVVQVKVDYTSTVGHLYFTSLSTTEPKITVTPWCGWANPNCWGAGDSKFQWNSSNNPLYTHVWITAAADTAPGQYHVTLTTTANNVVRSLNVPITVLAAPSAITPWERPRVSGAPPGKGTWEGLMTSIAQTWCDPKKPYANTYSFGVESQVWYYDGAWVYFKVADYTNDPRWKDCALNIAQQYRQYVSSGNGAIPGWRVFTQGLRRAYEETGTASYRDAVGLIASNGLYSSSAGDPRDTVARETAYILRAWTDAHLLGFPTDATKVGRAVMYLLGHLRVFSNLPPQESTALEHQTFMGGIAMQALAYYYDHCTPDPRIPPTIKQYLDWLWQYGWDGNQGKLVWNPHPTNTGFPRHCQSGCQVYNRDLMNLTIWAYWWYWHHTGDDVYRQRGDEMFGYAVADPIDYSGKIFSQNFRDSIPAMALRFWRATSKQTGGRVKGGSSR